MKTALNPTTVYAVMAQRIDAKDSLDDFPTPPWATRALLEHVVENVGELRSQTCLEPACGVGHMAKVLEEYFGSVSASDVHPYGYGDSVDFTAHPVKVGSFDWIITNPPFRLGEDFIVKSLAVARVGVAMLTRTVFIESVGRYSRIFSVTPPTKVAQFVERVPMVKGRLDPKASTATGYCWLVWEKRKRTPSSRLVWIPPCRKELERQRDYEPPIKQSGSRAKSQQEQMNSAISKRKAPANAIDLFGWTGDGYPPAR